MRHHACLVLVCLIGVTALGPARPAQAQFWRKWTNTADSDKAKGQTEKHKGDANRRANAEKHYKRGQEFEAQGKHAAAEAQYRAALKIDPTYTGARARLGATRQHQGAIEEAIEIFEDIIGGEPRFSEAYALIVDALYVAGRFADAWEHVHRAEDQGMTVPRALRKKLAEKHPEPARKNATTRTDTNSGGETTTAPAGKGKGKGRGKK